MPLTNTQCQNAQPKAKPYKLTDGEGLHLLVNPNNSKYWRLAYRFDGKQKTLSLGTYPKVTIRQARALRGEAKGLLRLGGDPSLAKRQKKADKSRLNSNTFEAIALDWFNRKMADMSDSHKTRTLRLMTKDLFPSIGRMPITEITAPILLQVLRKVESRGAIETAHRVKQAAGQVFRYAVAIGMAERNPAADLTGALSSPVKTHLAAIIEPKAFGKLLIAIDGYMGTPAVTHALKLAPLLFVRPIELRQMEWAELDLEQGRWNLPAEKMKQRTEHIVPLSKQAIEILKAQHEFSGGGRYVFPSPRGASRPMSDNAVRTAIRALGFDNETMSGHGFRASARTMLDEILGFRVEVIEMQLAHKVRDTLGRAYNRTQYLDQRVSMMQTWADYLDTLRVEALGGNVITAKFKK